MDYAPLNLILHGNFVAFQQLWGLHSPVYSLIVDDFKGVSANVIGRRVS